METTAEGTETRAEFEAMRRLGCAQIQGFYFGRPMPAQEVARVLDRLRPQILVESAPEPAGAPPLEAASAGAATLSRARPSAPGGDALWPAAAGQTRGRIRQAPPRTPPG